MKKFLQANILQIAFIIALVSTLASLYFSEVMKLVPCILCWYQRIMMYPLVAILAVGILNKDKKVHLYALPLIILGLGIAIYHNLLYYHILPESVAPCVNGVSCTTRQIEWFGFFTIPLGSMIAFALLLVAMYIFKTQNKK